MNESPRLSGKAFGLLGKVAGWLGLTKSAINKLRSRRIRLGEDKGVMGDLVIGGRKKLFSPEQNRWLIKKVKKNPFLCPAQLK